MIGSILWSVLLIQLATGSPVQVVSREIKCNECNGAEVPQDVLNEGLASTRDEMLKSIQRVFPDFAENLEFLMIHKLKKFQSEMMQKEKESNFLKYFASLIDEIIKNSCEVYPKACESGKQAKKAITEYKIFQKVQDINGQFTTAPLNNDSCRFTDKNKWKECKIKKYNLLKKIFNVTNSCMYSDEDCSKYHYD